MTDTVGGYAVEVDDGGFHDTFISMVCDCDDLMAFFSCGQLLPDNDLEASIIGRKIDLMLEAINARMEINDRPFRLTLVFTKVDTINDKGRREITDLFEGLISDDCGRRIDVNHFFVSNNPHNPKSPEMPLLSLITHHFMRMEDEIQRKDESEYGFCQRWVIRKVVDSLLHHMEKNTWNGMWRTYRDGLGL